MQMYMISISRAKITTSMTLATSTNAYQATCLTSPRTMDHQSEDKDHNGKDKQCQYRSILLFFKFDWIFHDSLHYCVRDTNIIIPKDNDFFDCPFAHSDSAGWTITGILEMDYSGNQPRSILAVIPSYQVVENTMLKKPGIVWNLTHPKRNLLWDRDPCYLRHNSPPREKCQYNALAPQWV